MRSPNEDRKLRILGNKIITAYNEKDMDAIETHTSSPDDSYLEKDMRQLWNTYFTDGKVYDSDKDILQILSMIPYKLWPKEIYLEAALVLSKVLHRPVIAQSEPDLLNNESRFLLKYMSDRTSQMGEDGIIEKIFSTIGINKSWCVEFGAWDGRFCSNTYNLLANCGWHGVLIEAEVDRFKKLIETYEGNHRAHLFHQMVGFNPESNSIDYILSKTNIPKKFDLMVVDIDGNDWHVWNSMQKYHPRVVLIEFNQTIPNDVLYIQERDEAQQRGCSLRALIELGKLKGYKLVCVTSSNAFFVLKKEYKKFNISDNSIDAMYTPVNNGRIFHGYDSSIHVIGMPNLLWDWHGLGRNWEEFVSDHLEIY